MRPVALSWIATVLVSFTAGASGSSDAGLRYYQSKDYARAMETWTGCAESEDPECQFELGLMYKWGKAVPRNAKLSIQWSVE